jgi:hypothetical protein
VRVDGPLPGSNVHLLVNGVSKIQMPVTSTTTYIPLAGAGLNGGDQLTARWYLGAEVSDPSPVPLVVLPAPSKLGPLVYLSQVHDCVDWILLGGAYPGALVEVYNGATQIGAEVAPGDVVAVRIAGAINTGNVLHAVQSVQTPSGPVKSDSTPSLPSEAPPYRERSLPPPAIGPVPGCAQAVPVSGLLQGASTHLTAGSGVLYYPFVGAAFWALLGREAHPPESFSASQHFERCHVFSPSSAPPVPVDKALPLRKPAIQQGSITCPAAQAIVVTNLEPGAVVTFKIVGPSGTTVIGRIGVGQGVSSAQFWLPDLSGQVPPAPPYPAMVVVQEFCGQSAESDPVYFTKFQGGVFPPFIIEPVTECAHYVQLNMEGGAVVRLYSDQADSPVISAPTYVYSNNWIKTYRGLRVGEHITAKLEASCQPPELKVSPPVEVQGLPTLPAPKVLEPVRVFHTVVWLKDVVPGAQVHVFVNGQWRATAPATGMYAGVLTVFVGALKPEDKITALQAICTKLSRQTDPPAMVKFGQMKVWSEPGSLVQGQPASVTIKAVDVDNKSPVAGTVSLGGSVAGVTNKPIAVSPALGQAALTFSVSAPGYTTETLAVPASPPAPVKPAVLTIVTALGFNASKKSITEITWHLLGPSGSFTKTEKPNTNPAAVQFALPKPSGSFTPFTLSCLVKFEYENFNFIAGASGTGSSNWIEGGLIKPSPSTIELHWTGVDTTANFAVEWIQSIDTFVVKFYGTS